MLEILEDRLVPTTIKLSNLTGLDPSVGIAWVAGFNGGGSNGLTTTTNGNGTFTGSTQAFYQIGSGANQIDTITFSSGGGRLIFVVSATQPTTLPVGQGSYTPAPYPTAPAVLPAGPQDFFEFSYNGNFNATQVQGLGLTVSFTVPNINGSGVTETYGVQPNFTRAQIGAAYTTFMTNDPLGTEYDKLLYPSGTYPLPGGLTVPGSQFFEIVDPFDWITNYPSDSLATYWESTLTNFFKDGNYLSINLNAGSPTNIYSGTCSGGTYTLSNGTNTYTFSNPGTGLAGAQYVFGQANPGSGDQGLLQDNIWMALCRGVALDGVSLTSITNGETTTAWNNTAQWYKQHTSTAFPTFNSVYHTYAKFLHYSTIDGTDSRTGGTPIFYGNAAYGFSEDENPNGPYTGGQVPPKTINVVGPNDTVTITLGPWGSVAPSQADRLDFVDDPSFGFENKSQQVAVQVLDAQGNPVALGGEQITLTLTSPNGAILSEATENTDANGLATFKNLTIDQEGHYTLTATHTGGNPSVDIDPDISNVFSIADIGPLKLTADSYKVKADAPFQITVTAVDQYYQGTVQFKANVNATVDDGGTWKPLKGFTYTFTAADAGAHTFTVQLGKPYRGQRIKVFDTLRPLKVKGGHLFKVGKPVSLFQSSVLSAYGERNASGLFDVLTDGPASSTIQGNANISRRTYPADLWSTDRFFLHGQELTAQGASDSEGATARLDQLFTPTPTSDPLVDLLLDDLDLSWFS